MSSSLAATEARQERGKQIATMVNGQLKKKGDTWIVPSQVGKGKYNVSLDSTDPKTPMCTCPDFAERREPCKHVFAVKFILEHEVAEDGTETTRETVSLTRTTIKRPTYKQNWRAYNAAQTTEKARLQVLLRELCDGIADPPPGPRGGRPPVSLGDAVFAAAFKVYSTISGRRFMTDMEEAFTNGYVKRPVAYNTIFKYLENPEMTPILKRLIVESSKPLASIERDFAGDSSGFTTSRFVRWFDHKYGVVRQQHDWVKVHMMCGVTTNVVTAVEIKDRDASDPVQLPALLNQTAENFTIKEVSLDKVYASYSNYNAIESVGAAPFIPFKTIHNGNGPGCSPLWTKMFHFYSFNREEFDRHYHKRSNAESVFSMVKAKFGDAVRSKTDTAMTNEVLCKILCHNICCLIQSQHELGIEATFWGNGEKERTETTIETSEEGEAWEWV